MNGRDDLLEPFVIEARDLVARARGDLARLAVATDRDALDGLFRSIHTLKGSAAMLDLGPLTALLHASETRLEHIRKGRIFDEVAAAALTRVLDTAEAWIDALEAGREPATSVVEAARRLARQLEDRDAPHEAEPAAAETPAWAIALASEVPRQGATVAIRYTPTPECYFRGDDPVAIVRGIPGVIKLHITADPPGDPRAYDPFRCTLRLTAIAQARIADVEAALKLVRDQVELAVVEPAAAVAADGLRLRTLHIDADRLDAAAAILDELVIAKNALAHEVRLAGGRQLLARQAALDRLVSDLHGAVTDLRLTPLRQLFSRFPRQVREIADGLGKSVELEVAGEDVALDKGVVEGLFEPVLHLLRNAIDHGIEPPSVRHDLGKPERARILLSATAKGAEVEVEISDDGRGIDAGAVRALAVRRAAVTSEEAASMSDAAAAELIFAAGFSTAATLSDISGRGVGMDAVRTAVARLGGWVALDNRPGQGLKVRLTLPAQVLLKRILVVEAGGERFGVPLDAIRETHRVRRDELTAVRESRAYVRRETVIPLLRLGELLGGAQKAEPEVFPVLSISAGGDEVGVQVDSIGERLEAPMRPMAGLVAAYPGVLGTVLQGDGRVLLVLDLEELAA